MSIYDIREESVYGDPYVANPDWCKNEHILKWWTSEHDNKIQNAIAKYHWTWKNIDVCDQLCSCTPPDLLSMWKLEDPLCQQYAWYNILLGFADSRAYVLGWLNNIRRPQWEVCPLCNQRFIETSVTDSLVRRLTINQIDFCAPCLSRILFHSPDYKFVNKTEYNAYWEKNSAPFDEMIYSYVRRLTSIIQRIPSQNFGDNCRDLWGYTTGQRLEILKTLKEKDCLQLVNRLYGSWFTLLVKSGVLDDGAIKMPRGIKCLALDGHVCFSLGEKTIDDFLYVYNIPHEKEPKYPEGNFRADFLVNSVFVEYFGLAGNAEYDAKIENKKKLCCEHGIELISLFPNDLTDPRRLKKKLSKFLC